jgi:hypothetical protein
MIMHQENLDHDVSKQRMRSLSCRSAPLTCVRADRHGQLVDMLLEICPGVHDKHVICEGKQKIMCVRMLKALCGMLVSSVLCHKKFRKDVEETGFEVNPCDMRVANE